MGYKQLLVPTDFHSVERTTTEVNGDHQLFGYHHSSVQQQKEIHAGLRNNLRVSKWWWNFKFWENIDSEMDFFFFLIFLWRK